MKISHYAELDLILLILKGELNEVELNKLAQEIDWDYLYRLIVRHRIVEQAYTVLAKYPQISPKFITNLRQTYQLIKLSLLSITAETIRLTRIFDIHSLPYLIVKGVPLAIEIYGGACNRQCKDIDIWIDPNNFERALELLLNDGYIQKLPTYQLDGYKKDYYLRHKHDVELCHPLRKVELELHFRLNYFGLNFFVFDEVATRQINLKNANITTLQNDYHVLYLMLHGTIHAWSRLRWLQDIYLYLKQNKCNLAHVYQLSLKLNCPHIVLQTLLLLKNVYKYENKEIDELLTMIDKRGVELAFRAQQFIVADYELTGGHGIFNKMFFKYRIYLAKAAIKGQKGTAVFGDLFKIDRLFPYLTLPRGYEFGYYLIYPLWVIKYIFTRK